MVTPKTRLIATEMTVMTAVSCSACSTCASAKASVRAVRPSSKVNCATSQTGQITSRNK
jgi:hypothetical protein